jgi:sugar lactone lactonase YvrE
MTASEKLSAEMILERGGTSILIDTAGNLYLASGQIFVYNKRHEQIGVVEIPERPSSLAWGGPEGKTLFIGARSSLYAIGTANPGAEPR